jgi:hypothetical protein
MHLVNEAVNNKVDVFVFTSSIAVYGTNQAILSLSRPLWRYCGPGRSRTAMRIAVHRRVPFRFVCLFAWVRPVCGTAAPACRLKL